MVGHPGRHPGAVLGVARFFHDPRGSMRGVLDSRPGEGRLAAYAMAAAAVLVSGLIPARLASSQEEPAGVVAAQVFSLPFLVLAFYAMALLVTLLARAFGGAGGFRAGRAAFFWAALVASPVMVLSGLAPMAFEGASPLLVVPVSQTGPVFFAWALAQCYAEAFGFRRGWAVFAFIAALALLIVGGAWLASR